MKLLNQTVKEAFSRALQATFPSLPDHTPVIGSSKYGDFQCNSALSIWKRHGKELGLSSAKEAAERLAEYMREDHSSLFCNIQVASQGFLTVDIARAWLQSDLATFLSQQQQLFLPPLSSKKKVVVDFSSPNVAKEMHVGHLRSTIIGESICRILEFRGHSVERVNHVGDWGTQFGMLIEYLHSFLRYTYPPKKNEIRLYVVCVQKFPQYKENMPDISDLNAFYKQAKAAFDASEDFKRRSRDMVVKLQGGDAAALDSWRLICEISRKEFDKVYRRLGVQLEERGESSYNSVLPDVVKELTQKQLVTESNGAKCVFTSVGDVPLFLMKSDGGYGYDSTDLAAIRDRLVTRKSDWLIYVTDLGQEDHFMKLFAAATAAGWHIPPHTRVDHVGFGVVQGQDGKRFKTRSGEPVKLVDLLDEATSRALKELQRRRKEEDEKQDEQEEGEARQRGEKKEDEEEKKQTKGENKCDLRAVALHKENRENTTSQDKNERKTKNEGVEKKKERPESPSYSCEKKNEESRAGLENNSEQHETQKREEKENEVVLAPGALCQERNAIDNGIARPSEEEATEEMKRAAEAIGYSAVKYFDLKQNRNTDYKFSYDRMLDPKGNTAVYMLYAYARICAIFRKAGVDPSTVDPRELRLEEPEERKLGVLLAQFPDVVSAILEDLHVHRLAEYMYKVAGAFTDFYQTCKVLGVPQQNSRLLLSECTRKVLDNCFHLLGITPLQRL